MSKGACAFSCKGCGQAARIVGELGDLRQMMDSMKRMMINLFSKITNIHDKQAMNMHVILLRMTH